MIAEPSLKKLRNKLLLINLIGLTLIITISFSMIYINFYNRAQNEIRQTLNSIPRSVQENEILTSGYSVTSVTAGGHGGDNLTIIGGGRLPVDYSKSFIVNISEEGYASIFSILNINEDSYLQAIESVLAAGSVTGVTELDGRYWAYDVKGGTGYQGSSYVLSIVFLDIHETNNNLNALLISLIIIGIIAVGVIFMISMLVSNRAIRPVEENMVRQRRFVADASHELKTPIAVIAANAEAAAGAEASGTAKWIGNISDEANRMNELVDSLLSLAKAEEKKVDKSEFDLISAVREETDRIEVFLFEKELTFNFETDAPDTEPVMIVSDKAKIQAILSALLENAAKYTSPHGSVTVRAGRNSVSVSNTGAFIPAENLEHIFDRFYRIDPSRNSETGGHGIGLSIAKEIAGALGGDLKAESVPQNENEAINTFTLFL